MRSCFLLFSFLVAFQLYAQSPSKSDLAPCGAPPGFDPWLLEYFEHPGEYPTRNDDTLKAGIQIHWVGRNDGTGRFSASSILDAFCRLNQDYAAAGIRFYFKNDWHLIDSTAWYNHTSLPQGIAMMLANDVPDAQNTYFVSNPAGNCGYNLPYAGVALSHGCAGANDHTWAHEVGHALSLPHPFIGWESKTYNFNTPTPTRLTYDYTYFHDTLDTQIGKLDTALVEFVNGSNCTIAADKFCDTKPDYISNRWNCDAQGKSTIKQKDPSGAEFYSDGTLFMSYSNDECQNRFTPQQIAALRANLLSEKVAWLTTKTPPPPITDIPTLVAPLNGDAAPATGAVLQWKPVPNATRYTVQVTRINNFNAIEKEYVTSDTSIVLGALVVNKNYLWRVRPFNEWQPCTSFSEGGRFLTVPVGSAATEPDADGWRCYPDPLSVGQPLTLELPEAWLGSALRITLFNAMGSACFQQAIHPSSRRLEVNFSEAAPIPGAYFLQVAGKNGVKSQAVIFQAE